MSSSIPPDFQEQIDTIHDEIIKYIDKNNPDTSADIREKIDHVVLKWRQQSLSDRVNLAPHLEYTIASANNAQKLRVEDSSPSDKKKTQSRLNRIFKFLFNCFHKSSTPIAPELTIAPDIQNELDAIKEANITNPASNSTVISGINSETTSNPNSLDGSHNLPLKAGESLIEAQQQDETTSLSNQIEELLNEEETFDFTINDPEFSDFKISNLKEELEEIQNSFQSKKIEKETEEDIKTIINTFNFATECNKKLQNKQPKETRKDSPEAIESIKETQNQIEEIYRTIENKPIVRAIKIIIANKVQKITEILEKTKTDNGIINNLPELQEEIDRVLIITECLKKYFPKP